MVNYDKVKDTLEGALVTGLTCEDPVPYLKPAIDYLKAFPDEAAGKVSVFRGPTAGVLKDFRQGLETVAN